MFWVSVPIYLYTLDCCCCIVAVFILSISILFICMYSMWVFLMIICSPFEFFFHSFTLVLIMHKSIHCSLSMHALVSVYCTVQQFNTTFFVCSAFSIALTKCNAECCRFAYFSLEETVIFYSDRNFATLDTIVMETVNWKGIDESFLFWFL